MNRRSYQRNYRRLPVVQSLNLNEEQTSTSRYFAFSPSFTTILRLYIGEVDSRTRFSREKASFFERRMGVRAKSRAVQCCVPTI
jgi:hypothetical protein